MLVHLHLPDPSPYVEDTRGDRGLALSLRVISFRQRWCVGQVCLRCRSSAWTLGTYATPADAQRALADYVRQELRGL
jgi:hypothetical protein